MSVIPSTETAGAIFWQALCFVESICNLGSRGWRIWQTWNDPNIGKIEKAFYMTVDGTGVLANTTLLANAYHPILENSDAKNLQRVTNAAVFGGDLYRMANDENCKASTIVTFATQALLATSQQENGGKTLKQVLLISGLIAKCHTDQEWIYEQTNTAVNMANMFLKHIARRLNQHQENNVEESCPEENDTQLNPFIQKDPQADYEDRILQVRKDLPNVTELEILEVVKKDFNEALNALINSMQENNFIINKKDASEFTRIPSILFDREEFKKMKCRITFKPIREVVIILEPDTNTPIYYEFSTLKAVKAIYNKKKDKEKNLPIGWPKSIPFSKEFIQSDEEKTELITEALNQAILNPEVQLLAKLILPESKKLRDHFEKTLEICDKEIDLLKKIQEANKSTT